MTSDAPLRELLGRLLTWEDAHVGFDAAIADIPADARGMQPSGLPYSPWQLLEHLRRTQRDILEFCRNPDYQELKWPDDYWPPSPAPPSPAAWDESIGQFRQDRSALQQLAANLKTDLAARIPHGNGQTYLRELVLAADHTAYHVGQLIVVRRLLGVWMPH
ncbi:MAG: DinB family protein [bacterium]